MLDITSGFGFWFTIGAVVAAAATLQAAVGFGFNLLAVSVLVFLYDDPAIIVPALILAWYPVGVALVVRNHRDINYRRIAWWIGPAIPGTILGVMLLRDLPEVTMRRIIGTVTILSAIAITLRLTNPVKHEWPWLLGTGGLSGVLAGSTGMSGPPIVLFGINQNWETSGFRATLFLYFACLGMFTIGWLFYEDMVDAEVWRVVWASLPGLLFGFFAGSALAKHLHGERFRRLAIVLLIIAGVMPWLK